MAACTTKAIDDLDDDSEEEDDSEEDDATVTAARPTNTNHKRVMFKNALKAQRENKAEECLKLTQQLTTESPRHARAWALRSSVERTASDAVAAASRAHELRPDLSMTRRALSGALTRLDFYEHGKRRRTSCELLKRAAALVPEDPKAQFRLGRAARQLKDLPVARDAFEKTLTLDPAHDRAAFWLQAITDDDDGKVTRAPAEHVRALYDDYASRYDEHLVTTLRSRAPELLALAMRDAVLESLEDDHNGHELRGLDLGSGTGLSGLALTDALLKKTKRVSVEWHGVDLSTHMCAKAKARGCYASVRAMDLIEALCTDPPYHCFASCDVLCYFGDLEPVFDAAKRNCCSSPRHSPRFKQWRALFGVTLEEEEEEDDAGHRHHHGWRLAPTGRFRHSPNYVIDAARRHGWHCLTNTDVVLRRQSGLPVRGRVFVFALALSPQSVASSPDAEGRGSPPAASSSVEEVEAGRDGLLPPTKDGEHSPAATGVSHGAGDEKVA